MLPVDDVGVELVAGSLAMITRQASLMRLHDLVSNRGGLTLERSAYPLLNQILALQGGRLSDIAAGLKVAVPTVSRQVRQLEELGLVVRTQDPIDARAILLEVTPAGLDAFEWAHEGQRLGAGELCINSIDRDGTKLGYDLEITRRISESVSIPVIASGGAGEPRHLYEAFTAGAADAALVASIVHYGEYPIAELKRYLNHRGIEVR